MHEYTYLACIISTNLLSFITESKMKVVSYNPQRVIKQLGYEQSTIYKKKMGCSNTLTTESQLAGKGREHIVSNFHSI